MISGLGFSDSCQNPVQMTRPSKSVGDTQVSKDKDFTYCMPLGHRMDCINALTWRSLLTPVLIGFSARADAEPPVGKLLPHLQCCTDG